MDATLASKIAAASKDVGGKLNPDKRNQEQRYDYISADKILAICGQALASQGVTVFPAIMDANAEIVTYTKSYQGKVEEKSRIDARVQFLMKITDGSETQDLMWFGFGTDYTTPDKAVYKAITSGHKYFLVKLLNVGAGNEDGEHDEQEQPVVQRRQSAQPRPQTKANGTQAQADGTPAYKRLPRPWPAAVAIEAIRDVAASTKHELDANGQWGALIGLLDGSPFDTQQRHRLLLDVFGVESSKALNGAQRYALHAWAKPAKIGDTWALDANAVAEYQSIVNDNRMSDAELDADEEPGF